MYEAMPEKLKVSSIEQLARQQVDGIVRRDESGREDFFESIIPSTCKHTIHAHDGGCGSILIEHNSYKLVSGVQDRTVKIWDATMDALDSQTCQLWHSFSGHQDKVCDVDANRVSCCHIVATAIPYATTWIYSSFTLAMLTEAFTCVILKSSSDKRSSCTFTGNHICMPIK